MAAGSHQSPHKRQDTPRFARQASLTRATSGTPMTGSAGVGVDLPRRKLRRDTPMEESSAVAMGVWKYLNQ